jgi:hypothetical protein
VEGVRDQQLAHHPQRWVGTTHEREGWMMKPKLRVEEDGMQDEQYRWLEGHSTKKKKIFVFFRILLFDKKVSL